MCRKGILSQIYCTGIGNQPRGEHDHSDNDRGEDDLNNGNIHAPVEEGDSGDSCKPTVMSYLLLMLCM